MTYIQLDMTCTDVTKVNVNHDVVGICGYRGGEGASVACFSIY